MVAKRYSDKKSGTKLTKGQKDSIKLIGSNMKMLDPKSTVRKGERKRTKK